jgi:hypothetical protein
VPEMSGDPDLGRETTRIVALCHGKSWRSSLAHQRKTAMGRRFSLVNTLRPAGRNRSGCHRIRLA